jgi:ligand-binding sensor domain-containing protein
MVSHSNVRLLTLAAKMKEALNLAQGQRLAYFDANKSFKTLMLVVNDKKTFFFYTLVELNKLQHLSLESFVRQV